MPPQTGTESTAWSPALEPDVDAIPTAATAEFVMRRSRVALPTAANTLGPITKDPISLEIQLSTTPLVKTTFDPKAIEKLIKIFQPISKQRPEDLSQATSVSHYIPTVDPDERRFAESVAFIESAAAPNVGRPLANRIRELRGFCRDESEPFDVDSVERFAEFWSTQPDLRPPELVITPRGNVRAVWDQGENCFLGLEFLPDGQARFVLFAPPAPPSSKPSLFGGILPVEDLADTLRPLAHSAWPGAH